MMLGGCTAMLPDRLSIGATFDAETLEARSYTATLHWNLKP